MRRGLDLGNGCADSLRRLIGVVLQDREVSLVVGRDALGEIALGKRIEHMDEVIQRLGDVLAQRIERGADAEHESGLAFEVDALREIADNRRRDDAANRRFELAGHLSHRRFTFGSGFFILFDLFFRFTLGFLGGFDFEGLDRSRDIADFVLAAKARQHNGKVSGCELFHRTGQGGERSGNCPVHIESHDDADTESHQGSADHQIAAEVVTVVRDIVHLGRIRQAIRDDLFVSVLDLGELLDGNTEYRVFRVIKRLFLESGNCRLDAFLDKRVTSARPLLDQLLVLITCEMLAVSPNQFVDFVEIVFGAIGVFSDVTGTWPRNDRNDQLLDTVVHEIIDLSELTDRDQAFLVDFSEIVIRAAEPTHRDHHDNGHRKGDQDKDSHHLRLDRQVFHD